MVERPDEVPALGGVPARSGTPQLSLSGTQVMMQGWLTSRRRTSIHSRVSRLDRVRLNAYALASPPRRAGPSRSHQARKRGSSIFWWMRAPVEAERLHQLDLGAQRVVVGRGQVRLRPVALLEHEPQVVGPAVEQEPVRSAETARIAV